MTASLRDRRFFDARIRESNFIMRECAKRHSRVTCEFELWRDCVKMSAASEFRKGVLSFLTEKSIGFRYQTR